MRVLGINTGTSVDGVDFALIDWDLQNLKNFKLIAQKSYDFDPELKLSINKIINKQQASLDELSDTNFAFSYYLADLIQDFKKHLPPNTQIELIGFHGQTIFHGEKSTWQIGDNSIVSNITGIPAISGFRSADMAVGGCGAPLTSYIDDVLLKQKDLNIATLNIGGISNISYMPIEGKTIGYDTGPGNTLVDTLMQMLFKKNFDESGETAKRGKVNHRFIEQLYSSTEYFSQPTPKSTGRELFDHKYANKFLDLGNKENIIATAAYFTVHSITQELKKYTIDKLYYAGGGSQNAFIMDALEENNPEITFISHEEFGINWQYKEAMLFSLLAFTCFNKVPNNVPDSTGARKTTILGKVSYV